MASDVNIAELRRIEQAMLPAPWIKSGIRQKLGAEDCLRIGPDGKPIAFLPIGHSAQDHRGALNDAEGLVAMRNAFPSVLDELKELREDVRTAVDEIADLKRQLQDALRLAKR